ncbi:MULTISPECIES: restriction endonuclease subunit S [Vibrio]|jgi:type I restriction enzyme S subunit|uniref:restriction endonuclease subunit S n=1 Tax=Vibrio TaxID=662 RepID=UPI00186A384A|nr:MULTISPECIES: restriction endonuclease subunit S [Vibrio]EJE4173814.1 restriction endonuclease subunit S [Vibrio parahaemolyticus]MBO0207312.1 restriction endonuclease subunit S [Vibrio sp. Vb0877]MDF4422156.1 restriction endonuclease subunit S [Vibrio parahaemolyticus]MDW1745852.1 restriction endonuclease subunit S [Vibrio sp. Vb2531]MDW2130629.1 restriction endonuclease subunit S [Vibrio sp. 2129(2023)]
MESITSTPKYDQYIDSGYEWIGEIPQHWDLVKLGSCLSPVSVKNCPELPLLSITRERGVIERDVDDQESNHNFIPDDLSGYKKLEKGQFGMNKMKAWQGSYGVSEFTGIVSPAYFVFDFTKAINPEFFNWAIRSKLYVSFFGSASDGVRIGQWDLSKARMKVIPFVLPSEEEQSLIANFLGKKTAQIDDAIAIKEQQISLLKERKQIIIQQAVTQGLDPNVPMKDSGVDWIGKIPAHWEVRRSKFVFTQRKERAWKDDVQLSATQAYGVIPQDQYEELTGKRVVKIQLHLDKRKHVERDDFVISMRSFQGGLERAWSQGCIRSSYVVLRALDEIYPSFYGYLLKLPSYIAALQQTASFIRDGQDLNFDNFSKVDLFIPPIEEQKEIANYVSAFMKSSDEGIELLLAQIEKLKEYKTSLINSAVTGKIKITPEMVEQ